MFVAGCGGGGGGGTATGGRNLGDTCPGNPSGQMVYSTTWGTTPATASQVVLVKDAAGNVVLSDAVNRAGQATSTLPPMNLPSGVYEVKVLLHSQPNAGGNPVKELSALIDLCGSSGPVAVTSLASEQAKQLTINPVADTMKQNQTKRFIAMAKGASGNPAFVPVGSVDWTATGSVGTISDVGVFTAKSPGTATIRATVNGLALSAQSTMKVEAFNPTRGKWTVLVYMNAANDLQPASDLNVNQMESVAGNSKVRFVVQWKESKSAFASSTFDGVRRYLVKPDTDITQVKSELLQDNLVDNAGNALDMGKPETLLDFVKWGKANFPADRYVLVIWNHGNGWKRKPNDWGTRGFSYDDQYGTRIDTWQIDQALAGQHFDILAWDASLMQMLEVAYEARPYGDYIVGSEESPPAEGYPYDDVFRAFRDTPNATTASLTRGFVDAMVNNPPYATRKITQSVLDSSKLPAVASAVNILGHQLFNNKATMANVIQSVRNSAQSYSPNSTRVYRDLLDICRLIKAQASVPSSVKTAATNVETAVLDALVYEGHNSQSANSRGVAIDFSEGSLFQTYRSDYIQMKFAKNTFWDEYLGAAP